MKLLMTLAAAIALLVAALPVASEEAECDVECLAQLHYEDAELVCDVEWVVPFHRQQRYRWKDGVKFDRFAWAQEAEGLLEYSGDKLEVRLIDGNGRHVSWVDATYTCDYDTNTGAAMKWDIYNKDTGELLWSEADEPSEPVVEDECDLECHYLRYEESAEEPCQRMIEQHVSQYSYRWKVGMLRSRFESGGWYNKSEGLFTYSGERLEVFLDGSWVWAKYSCIYDTNSGRALFGEVFRKDMVE